MKFQICLFFWLITTIHATGQFNVIGVIYDPNGEPLPDAFVILANEDETYTDADGFFEFYHVASGEYVLQISHIGFEEIVQKLNIVADIYLDLDMKWEYHDEVAIEINASRAQKEGPIPLSQLDDADLAQDNFGQDVPFLLNFTPSVVVSSDAGAGIGYSGIRIRGTDPARTNVTINGIPLNDGESQGVFWVDLPDLLSSSEGIQIQRGIGTSTNGAGSFGATIGLETDGLTQEASAAYTGSAGSYNTFKHTLSFGTGVIQGKWNFGARLSKISSDGYIDRASSDLKSFFATASYISGKTVIKANVFGGKEVTYQSWFGTPESRLNNDIDAMNIHASNNGYTDAQLQNLLNSGRTYNFYLHENEVDDYQQDHYQLHLGHQLKQDVVLNLSLHYTRGLGFFEQEKLEDDLEDYGIEPFEIGGTTIEHSDIIRRRWLDNDFYGFIANLKGQNAHLDWIIGGGWNAYKGDHFGQIAWTEFGSSIVPGHEYYRSDATKQDANIYAKANFRVGESLGLFGDLQYRRVTYTSEGLDNDRQPVSIDTEHNFFNPKVGLTYQINEQHRLYGYVGLGHGEPVRNDYTDRSDKPDVEQLIDYELGYALSLNKISLQANFFYMDYHDQLIATGELNDVGSAIRTNVPDSYRAGMELQANWRLHDHWTIFGNVTLSQNKIREITEIIYDYTPGNNPEIFNRHVDSDLALSPEVVASARLEYRPSDRFVALLQNKYVGEQYLDNTSNAQRRIDDSFISNLLIRYQLVNKKPARIGMGLKVNNLFNVEYETNGYTFGYVYQDLVTENFYYPQAKRNFVVSLDINF